MTRREEIEWEAGGIVNRMIGRGVSQCYDTYYLAFQEGAKWADKTMIEKATQWLFENVYDYLNPEDQERVESFRKYLEEQYDRTIT